MKVFPSIQSSATTPPNSGPAVAFCRQRHSGDLVDEFKAIQSHNALTFERDAIRNPDLCTVSGALADVKNVLTEARQAWSEAGKPPGTVFLSIQYPNPEKGQSLLKLVSRFNRLMNPNTAGERLLLKAFRVASRIKGDMSEVEAIRMPSNPDCILVKFDMSGVEKGDLDRAEKFLGNRQLLRLVEKLRG